MASYVEENIEKLTEEQNNVYETIMTKIRQENGGIIYLDAPGGTGKTFLTKLILAEVRSQKKIALAVASTGIAASLLPNGSTLTGLLKSLWI